MNAMTREDCLRTCQDPEFRKAASAFCLSPTQANADYLRRFGHSDASLDWCLDYLYAVRFCGREGMLAIRVSKADA